jgi:hypothetical protein
LTIQECIAGSLSFNGQRCGKIIYVHVLQMTRLLPKWMLSLLEILGKTGRMLTPLPEARIIFSDDAIKMAHNPQ